MKLLFGYQILLFSETLRNSPVFRNVTVNTLLWPLPTGLLHPVLSTLHPDALSKEGKYSKEGLCSLANHLASFPTSDLFRALSNMCAQILAQMDHSMGAHGRLSTQIVGWWPLCFWLPRSLPGHVHLGRVPWPQEWQMWSSYIFIPAEFSAFVLGLSGKTKFHLFCLTNSSCSAQGPIYFLVIQINPPLPILSPQSKTHFPFSTV